MNIHARGGFGKFPRFQWRYFLVSDLSRTDRSIYCNLDENPHFLVCAVQVQVHLTSYSLDPDCPAFICHQFPYHIIFAIRSHFVLQWTGRDRCDPAVAWRWVPHHGKGNDESRQESFRLGVIVDLDGGNNGNRRCGRLATISWDGGMGAVCWEERLKRWWGLEDWVNS